MSIRDNSNHLVVDPYSDHAYFDGMYIKTDTLGDPRKDMVPPIKLEEQVFVCKQMVELVRKLVEIKGGDFRILDIGTGSGILSIYLDRALRDGDTKDKYTIQAIDTSQRALDQAKFNVRVNECLKIAIPEKADKYSLSTVDENSLDLILVSSPFNPTCPKLRNSDSICTNSNKLGLSILQEWFEYSSKHLKPSGILIGCCMTPISTDGKLVILEELKITFGSNSKIRYCRILPGAYPIKDFLEKQYCDYFRNDNTEKLTEWINNVFHPHTLFSFIYFEAQIEGGSGDISESIKPVFSSYNQSWEQRIQLHRFFVNNLKDRLGFNSTNNLSDIDLLKVEQTIRNSHGTDNLSNDPQIVKSLAVPISKYLENKLKTFDLTNKDSHWIQKNIKWMFFECGIFCPYDLIDAPWDLLDFGMIKWLTKSENTDFKAQEIFKSWQHVLQQSVLQKQSISFSPSFSRSNSREKWSPSIGNREDFLITISNEIIDSKEFDNLFVSKNSLEVDNSINIDEQTYFKILHAFKLPFQENALNQTISVHDAQKKFHVSLHKLLAKKQVLSSETFYISIPLYVQCPDHDLSENEDTFIFPYSTAGCIFLFGELNELPKEDTWEKLKDIAIGMRDDISAIASGYAYYRSGDKAFLGIWNKIYHELDQHRKLLRKEAVPVIIDTIRLMVDLLFSNRSNDNVITSRFIESFLDKKFEELVDTLIQYSIINYLIKSKLIGEEISEKQHLVEEAVNKFKEESFNSKFKIIYLSEEVRNSRVGELGLQRFASVLTCAINNVFGKYKSKVTIFFGTEVRIINDINKNVEKKVGSYGTHFVLRSMLKPAEKPNLTFEILDANILQDFHEYNEWQDSVNTNFWITKFPLIIKLDK
jgi:methylase of polypeptide subunit release factors